MTAVTFEAQGEGRYLVIRCQPRQRIGLVLGKSGNWLAESLTGEVLGHAKTRKKAAALLMQ